MTCTVKVKNAKQLKKTNQSNLPASKKTTQTPTPAVGTNPIETSTPDNEPKKKVVSISYSRGAEIWFFRKRETASRHR